MEPPTLKYLCAETILQKLPSLQHLDELEPIIGSRLSEQLFLTPINFDEKLFASPVDEKNFYHHNFQFYKKEFYKHFFNKFEFDIIFTKKYIKWLKNWSKPHPWLLFSVSNAAVVLLQYMFIYEETKSCMKNEGMKKTTTPVVYDLCLKCMVKMVKLNQINTNHLQRYFSAVFYNLIPNHLESLDFKVCSRCRQVPLLRFYTFGFFQNIFGNFSNVHYLFREIKTPRVWNFGPPVGNIFGFEKKHFDVKNCVYYQTFEKCLTVESSRDDFIKNGIYVFRQCLKHDDFVQQLIFK